MCRQPRDHSKGTQWSVRMISILDTLIKNSIIEYHFSKWYSNTKSMFHKLKLSLYQSYTESPVTKATWRKPRMLLRFTSCTNTTQWNVRWHKCAPNASGSMRWSRNSFAVFERLDKNFRPSPLGGLLKCFGELHTFAHSHIHASPHSAMAGIALGVMSSMIMMPSPCPKNVKKNSLEPETAPGNTPYTLHRLQVGQWSWCLVPVLKCANDHDA